MPLPKPRAGEEQNSFVSRCVSFVVDEGTVPNTEAGRKQAVAMCYSTWRDAKKSEDIINTLGELVNKAETTNTPSWGSIPKTKENFPNKSDFIVQRGKNWSDYKLPYKFHGKIHCGGVKACAGAIGGSRSGKPMSLTSEEKARLNRAKRACGIGEKCTSC